MHGYRYRYGPGTDAIRVWHRHRCGTSYGTGIGTVRVRYRYRYGTSTGHGYRYGTGTGIRHLQGTPEWHAIWVSIRAPRERPAAFSFCGFRSLDASGGAIAGSVRNQQEIAMCSAAGAAFGRAGVRAGIRTGVAMWGNRAVSVNPAQWLGEVPP